MKDKFEGDDKDKIVKAVQETLNWLDKNQLAEKGEFEDVDVDLVDGRYCQGRCSETHARRHALEGSHYVWMHIADGKVYCIPDVYVFVNKSVAKGKRISWWRLAALSADSARQHGDRACPAHGNSVSELTCGGGLAATVDYDPDTSPALCFIESVCVGLANALYVHVLLTEFLYTW